MLSLLFLDRKLPPLGITWVKFSRKYDFFVSDLRVDKKRNSNTLCVTLLWTHEYSQWSLLDIWVFLSKVVTYFDGKIFLRPGFCIDRPAQTLDESHLRANLNFKVLFLNVAKKCDKNGCSGTLNVYQYINTCCCSICVHILHLHSLASKQECERKHKRIFLRAPHLTYDTGRNILQPFIMRLSLVNVTWKSITVGLLENFDDSEFFTHKKSMVWRSSRKN